MKIVLIAVTVSMLLIACGKESKNAQPIADASVSTAIDFLDSVYVSENGKNEWTFTRDGKVKSQQFGNQIETTYRIKDKIVSFTFPGGVPLAYTIEDDGSLYTPGLGRYIKKK